MQGVFSSHLVDVKSNHFVVSSEFWKFIVVMVRSSGCVDEEAPSRVGRDNENENGGYFSAFPLALLGLIADAGSYCEGEVLRASLLPDPLGTA